MMLQKLIAWAKEYRLLFLLFVILPVTLGSVIALKYDGGGVSSLYYGISVVAIFFLQAGTIAYTGLFNYVMRHGVIEKARTVFTNGSGLFPEFLKPLEIFTAGSLCLGLCVLIGLFIAATRSLLLLPIGIVGIGMGMFYSVPPLKLAFRPLGEAAWFLTVPLIALGAFIVQVPVVSLDTLVLHAHTFWIIVAASIPLAFMGLCGILVMDFTEDDPGKAAGKLKPAPNVYLFITLGVLSYAALFVDIALGMMPLRGILMLMTAPLLALAARRLARYKGEAKNMAMPVVYAVAACIVAGLLLILAYM